MEAVCIDHPHTLTAEEICKVLSVNPCVGLCTSDVHRLRKIYGYNELPHEPEKSWFSLIAAQFNDLLIWILLMAAFVSFILVAAGADAKEGLGSYVEPIVILIILFLNAVVGVWQESKAEKALAALKLLQPQLAHCLRNGQWSIIPSIELVPGDIVEIRVGDKVPADLRILELKSITLHVEQSQLTGESCSVSKQVAVMPIASQDCEIQQKSNLLFSSTTVVNGHAIGCVYATSIQSEIGIIQLAVKEASQEDEATPLRQKLDEFGKRLSYAITVICVFVWLINFKNFFDPIHGSFFGGGIYYFKISVALAVAAIPEGLPAVITTCLALGTKKMAAKNAIVRKLPSVETLGCTSVICSDKTGTLTTNEMTCVKLVVPQSSFSLKEFEIEGTFYSPIGNIYVKDDSIWRSFEHIKAEDTQLLWLARCASNCNNSKLLLQGEKHEIQGEPTEAAILTLIEKMGCPDKLINEENLQNFKRVDPMIFCNYWKSQYQLLATLEFTRERKSMSVLCKNKITQENMLFVKGAPESIIERCFSCMLPDGSCIALTDEMKQNLLKNVHCMAKDALRVLAFAISFDCGILRDYTGPSHPAHQHLLDYSNYANLEVQLTFMGLMGFLDPPRPEVRQAIRRCRSAGIKVMMITGDNQATAESIAQKIGILSTAVRSGKEECPPEAVTSSVSHAMKPVTEFTFYNEFKKQKLDVLLPLQWSLTGKEFEKLSEGDRSALLDSDGLVFSRMEPRHKQIVVKTLKNRNEVVAVTGDGVNDAPALKMADIGVAMGITGTEVAKEASDMILADDNFSNIVAAVQEGRSIYNNMKAFIRYLISSNIGEVASIFLTAALRIPEGLAPIQLLWVNLVTDGLPAIALGFNPPDTNVMCMPPRRRDEKLINGWVFFRYLVVGLYVGMATVGIFVWWYVLGVDPADGHTVIPFSYLSKWGECARWEEFTVNIVYGMNPADACTYFTAGKIKASTLCLTVLVIIEMLNALNALSEYESLFRMPPWANPYLVLAIAGSILVHCGILYIPILAKMFGVVPLSFHDWCWVIVWSLPVILIDECLKFFGRLMVIKSSKKDRQWTENKSSRISVKSD